MDFVRELNTNVSNIPIIKYIDVTLPLDSSNMKTKLTSNTKIISVICINTFGSVCKNLGISAVDGYWWLACDEPVLVSDAIVRIAYI